MSVYLSDEGQKHILGAVRRSLVWSLEVRGRILVDVIKPPCYSVQIYECIPGIYVIAIYIRV